MDSQVHFQSEVSGPADYKTPLSFAETPTEGEWYHSLPIRERIKGGGGEVGEREREMVEALVKFVCKPLSAGLSCQHF